MEDQNTGLIEGADGVTRCAWHGNLPDYLHYHDHEWGRPVTDDRRLFEKICLEGFQSGLSWLTILRKRENFRARLRQFRFRAASPHSPTPTSSGCSAMPASSAIAARSSRPSTMPGARIEMVEEAGSLAAWFWQFEPRPRRAARQSSICAASARQRRRRRSRCRISKELKKRGWSFVGPTTVYAFMQAMGLVNDHIEGCFCRQEIETERARLKRPQPRS